MSVLRTLTAALLVTAIVGTVAAQTRTANPPSIPDFGWGPSWVCCRPPGPSLRPEKMERDEVASTISSRGNGLAVAVRMWGDVADLKKGYEYELRYQMRLQHRGFQTPVLGTRDLPNGAAFKITSRTYTGGRWDGLEGSFDLTRKELATMTGLPDVEGIEEFVFIRVEPHLHDVTNRKFTTPEQTPAIILVANVGPKNLVYSLQTFGEWIEANGRYRTKEVAEALQKQTRDINHDGNYIANSVAKVLEIPDMPASEKVKLIRAVPKAAMGSKLSWDFNALLQKFVEGTDEELKAAAKEKLEEMRG